MLFGINAGWEERGYGVMLDGDFLADRSFRTWDDAVRNPWRVVANGGAVNHVAGVGAVPPGAQAYDGFVHVSAVAGAQTLVAQRLLGVVRAGTSYRVTLSSRATVGTPVLSMVLVRPEPFSTVSDTAYAATVVGPAWTPHVVDVLASQDMLDAFLYVAVAGPGEVDLDEVRLTRVSTGPLAVDPVMKALLGQLGVRSLLWPGGFAADHLDWRATVGPVWERAEMDTALHAPETPAFGLGEMLALCEELSLTPVIQLNPFAPPSEAADLVEYLRGDNTTPGGALRAMHGHPLPYNVMHAQVGNEPAEAWSPLNDPTGGDAYAANAQAIVAAVRAVDPALRVSAILEGTFQTATWLASAPLLAEWNARVMTGTHGLQSTVDAAHTHYYSAFAHPSSVEEAFTLEMAGGTVWRQAHALLRAASGPLPLWVTEYHLTLQDSADLVDPSFLFTASSGVAVADLMMALLQTDVEAAHFFNLSERVGFGALTHPLQWRARPAGLAFGLLSVAADSPRMGATLSPAPALLAVPALGNIPDATQVEELEVFAVSAPTGKPRVFLLNRHPTRDVTVAIFPAAAAQVFTLHHDSLAADNEVAADVVVMSSQVAQGAAFTVPHASVVRVDQQ
jgi:hypothetical protein